MIDINIPSPGESITEVEISNWLVENGDYVEQDQEIAEIESDKATLPLMASESGKIEIIAEAGETIQVGSVACKIDTSAKAPEKDESKKTEDKRREEPKSDDKAKKTTEDKNTDKQQDTKQTSSSEYNKVKVSPVAKKLMQENNLNVEDIIHGLKRIGKAEVEQVISNKSNSPVNQQKTEASREIERKRFLSCARS